MMMIDDDLQDTDFPKGDFGVRVDCLTKEIIIKMSKS